MTRTGTGQLLIKAQRGLEDEPAAVAIDFDDDGREALCARVESRNSAKRLRSEQQFDDQLIEALVREPPARQRRTVEDLRLQFVRPRTRVRPDADGIAGFADLGEQRLNRRVSAEPLRLLLEDQIAAHAAAREIPDALLVLGAIGMRIEMSRAVVARLLEQLDEEEERFDRLRRRIADPDRSGRVSDR